MSGSNTGQQWYEDENFHRFVGAGVGIFALGAVAFISAPVAIPAIGIGLGAIGLGGALSGTAIASGLFLTSAVVGGVVGGFSAPNIYKFASGLFEKKAKQPVIPTFFPGVEMMSPPFAAPHPLESQKIMKEEDAEQ
jgi:hypothetical protein